MFPPLGFKAGHAPGGAVQRSRGRQRQPQRHQSASWPASDATPLKSLAAAIGWETVQMPTRSDRWPRKSRAVNIGLEGQYKCREGAMIAPCRNKGSPCAPESGCLAVNQGVSVVVIRE